MVLQGSNLFPYLQARLLERLGLARIAPDSDLRMRVATMNLHWSSMGHLSTDNDYNGAPVYNVVFDMSGALVFTGGDDGLIKVWDSHSGRLQCTLHGIDVAGHIDDMAISPCNRYLAAVSGYAQKVVVYDIQDFLRPDARKLPSCMYPLGYVVTGGSSCISFSESADRNGRPGLSILTILTDSFKCLMFDASRFHDAQVEGAGSHVGSVRRPSLNETGVDLRRSAEAFVGSIRLDSARPMTISVVRSCPFLPGNYRKSRENPHEWIDADDAPSEDRNFSILCTCSDKTVRVCTFAPIKDSEGSHNGGSKSRSSDYSSAVVGSREFFVISDISPIKSSVNHLDTGNCAPLKFVISDSSPSGLVLFSYLDRVPPIGGHTKAEKTSRAKPALYDEDDDLGSTSRRKRHSGLDQLASKSGRKRRMPDRYDAAFDMENYYAEFEGVILDAEQDMRSYKLYGSNSDSHQSEAALSYKEPCKFVLEEPMKDASLDGTLFSPDDSVVLASYSQKGPRSSYFIKAYSGPWPTKDSNVDSGTYGAAKEVKSTRLECKYEGSVFVMQCAGMAGNSWMFITGAHDGVVSLQCLDLTSLRCETLKVIPISAGEILHGAIQTTSWGRTASGGPIRLACTDNIGHVHFLSSSSMRAAQPPAEQFFASDYHRDQRNGVLVDRRMNRVATAVRYAGFLTAAEETARMPAFIPLYRVEPNSKLIVSK